MRSIIFLSLFLSSGAGAQTLQELDSKRIEWIVKAFNQKPEALVEPLKPELVKLVNGVGRADVNKKAKFSYYVQTEKPADPMSKIVLIPMATSRFTPTYYQTDEWWDAHKDQKPMPRQPMEEVTAWLNEMKLTSNPDVLILQPDSGAMTRKPLQELLLEHYLAKYAVNGKITLYRGAEREGEAGQWEAGQRPASVRYWTPTANYAWRYARKNLNFVQELVAGRAPLLKFEIPVSDFKEMVLRRWSRLTLGTELTKKAHDSFDSGGVFRDHLAGGADFLGEGTFGVEFEIRSNRSGADEMKEYFKGTIGVAEIAEDRIRVIRQATARVQLQRPQESEELEKRADIRVNQIRLEARLLLLLQNKGEARLIQSMAAQINRPEITNIDGFSLAGFVSQELSKGGYGKNFDLDKIMESQVPALKRCGAVR